MNSKTGQSTIIESPEIEVSAHMGVQDMKKQDSKISGGMIHYSVNAVEGHWLARWKKDKVRFVPCTMYQDKFQIIKYLKVKIVLQMCY